MPSYWFCSFYAMETFLFYLRDAVIGDHMDLKRNVKCLKCGTEMNFVFNGNIELQQMTAVGKCPFCGNMLQIDFAVVEKTPATSEQEAAQQSIGGALETGIPGLDQALSNDLTSETLKNLME